LPPKVDAIEVALKAAFMANGQTYGSRRFVWVMRAQSFAIGRHRVHRKMQKPPNHNRDLGAGSLLKIYCVVTTAAVAAAEVVEVLSEVVEEALPLPPPPQPASTSSIAATKAINPPNVLNGFIKPPIKIGRRR
jgi:hypothetical protein